MRFACLAALILISHSFSFAQILTGNQTSQERNIYKASLYIDSTNSLGIDELKNQKFITNHGVANSENTSVTYWYKFSITNNVGNNTTWMLEFTDPHISKATLFNNGEKMNDIGYYHPFRNRSLRHKNIVFPVTIPKDSTKIFYARLWTDVNSNLDFKLSSPISFSNYSLKEYYILGAFYGTLFILAIYNLILFFVLRDKTHLFYVIYIICGGIQAFSEDGLGFQFLWPNLPVVNKFIISLSPGLFLLAFYIYSESFENIWKISKKVSTIAYASIFVLIVTSVIQNISDTSYRIWWVFYAIPFVLILVVAWKRSQEGEKAARIFLLGSSFILVYLVVFIGRVYGVIPSTIYTVYIFNYGLLLNAVVHSVALAEKIRATREAKVEIQEQLIGQLEENEQLKDKVNRELEGKVEERTRALIEKTHELENTVEELEKVKQELYRINSDLDLKNFRLRKEVENKTKLFIRGETLSFEDFKGIFPNAIACKIFLHDLKESSTIGCVKCGSQDYIEVDKFNRKCAKCKYPESVTANSLFHKVKFPIEKAFYITYIVAYSKEKYTIERLSEQLELRKNTCWTFKKKVEAKIESLEDSGKRDISFGEIVL